MDDASALVRRYFDEVWNKGHLTVADDLFSSELAAQLKRSAERLRAAFPDLRATVDEAFAAGDRVTARVTVRGTHLAALTLGNRIFEPTGKEVTVTTIEIFRAEGDRLVEHWEEGSYLHALRHIGAVSFVDGAPTAGARRWTRAAGWAIVLGAIAAVAWFNTSRGSSSTATTRPPAHPANEHYLQCNDALERRRAAEKALTTAPPAPRADAATYAIAKSGWDDARRAAQDLAARAEADIDRYCEP